MEIENISTERRHRYSKDAVLDAIEPLLRHGSERDRAQLAALAERIREHPMPFFWVTPSTKWVDLVKTDARDERS